MTLYAVKLPYVTELKVFSSWDKVVAFLEENYELEDREWAIVQEVEVDA